jgi:DNA polymerase III epsilon subunit-like protein
MFLDKTSERGAKLCIFFDLEATGLFPQEAEILEIGATARLLCPQGKWAVVGDNFHCLVRPCRKPPRKVLKLTGLTIPRLESEGVNFRMALFKWQTWLQHVEQLASAAVCEFRNLDVCIVAHNGLRYDIPLLLAQDARDNRRTLRMSAANLFDCLHHLTGIVDTLELARRLRAEGHLSQRSLKLAVLHESLVGLPLAGAHSALHDAVGLAAVCTHEPFHEAFLSSVCSSGQVAMTVHSALATASVYASRTLPWRRKSNNMLRPTDFRSDLKRKLEVEQSKTSKSIKTQRLHKSQCCSQTVVADRLAEACDGRSGSVISPADRLCTQSKGHGEADLRKVVDGRTCTDPCGTLVIIDDSQ